MENIKTIEVDRVTAQREYLSYREALKTKRDAFLHDLKVAYGHMRHGRAVIDVWQAFAEWGPYILILLTLAWAVGVAMGKLF